MAKHFRRVPQFEWPAKNAAARYENYAQLVQVAERMKKFGVEIDLGRMRQFQVDAEARAAQFTTVFCASTGLKPKDLGPGGSGTTAKVKEWFQRQGAPDVSFDKKSGRAQFNAVALTSWSEDYKKELFAEPAAALLGIRKAKTSARFAEAYHRVGTRFGGRIHFGFNPMGTKGLRWSASEKFSWLEDGELVKFSLNAQNVPSKDVKYTFKEFGELTIAESLRSAFIVRKGCTWLKFDFVGAEAYLIALNTGDLLLLQWLKAGRDADMHSENAKILFLEAKIPADVVKIDAEKGATDNQVKCREAAKNLQFALSYQMPSKRGVDKYPESYKFMKQRFPKMTEAYFDTIVQRFFAAHTAIRAWQNKVCGDVDTYGRVVLPQNGATLYVAQTAKGRNMSGNFFMQSGVGYVVNRAVPEVDKLCDWDPNGIALLLQIHDELDLQVPDEAVDDVEKAVKAELEKPADFGGTVAGIPVDCKKGDSWG